MTTKPASPGLSAALEPLRTMLSADGYSLDVRGFEDDALVVEITAGPEACAECLVPKTMMRTYLEAAFRNIPDAIPSEIRLIYPAD